MDTHLMTLGATLEAIERLHEAVPSSSKNVYRPFTCAVLNTYKLDVLDYIRDADQVESNLFWYPPPPGAVTSTKGGEVVKEEESGVAPVGAPARLPEPREYVPPTPLRKTAMDAEAKGLVRFNARTLLKAAQKLLDNYHHAPRAKKHIKALLKRHSELDKLTSQSEASISYAEDMISKLSHPAHGKQAAAELFGTSKAPMNVDEELGKLQDAIRTEKMEILAIEQTMEDLLEKRQRLLSQKAKTVPSDKVRRAPGKTTSAAPLSRSGSSTPQSVTPKKPTVAKASPKARSESRTTPRKAESQQATPIQKDMKARSFVPTADDGDTIVMAVHTGETSKDTEGVAAATLTKPESSDELERICENIWTLFGDNLRYVAVDREGADYQDTLRILQDLSIGGPGKSSHAQGDESMVSSSDGSQDTAATSGSTGSSQLENAGPPQPAIAIASHVLFTLLTTPAPHVMDFEELKAGGETWWREHGRAAYAASAVGRDAGEVSESSGSELASRAVYSLIAKKLLRLQFRGAKRIISFPAHIG